MSKHTVYASIIDAILDDVAPGGDADVSEGLQRGKDFRDISTDEADVDFLDSIAGESKHTSVPGGGVTAAATPEEWRGRSSRVADDLDSFLGAAMGRMAGEEGSDGLPSLTDQQVKASIDDMLHLGYSPARIAAKLEVVNHIFNKQFAHDHLESQAGNLGLVYLNPSHFGGSCQKSHDFIKAKGSVKAAAVKRIAACGSCNRCSGGRCSLYKLPIVASAEEATKVAQAKFATVKKAALVEIHNASQTAPAEVVTARSHANAVVRTAGDMQTIERPESPNAMRVSLIASKVKQGMDLQEAFEAVRDERGTPTAQAALKAYVAAEKKAGGPERRAIEEKTYSRQANHQTVSLKAQREETKVATIQEVAQLLQTGHTFGSAYSVIRGEIGSHMAGKLFNAYLTDLKKTGGKVNLNQIDCGYLKGKLASSNAIVGASKCASCTYRCNTMHCGLTGGTLLTFPGMDKAKTKRANYEGVNDGVQDMASFDMQADSMDLTYDEGPGDTMLGVDVPAVTRIDIE